MYLEGLGNENGSVFHTGRTSPIVTSVPPEDTRMFLLRLSWSCYTKRLPPTILPVQAEPKDINLFVLFLGYFGSTSLYWCVITGTHRSSWLIRIVYCCDSIAINVRVSGDFSFFSKCLYYIHTSLNDKPFWNRVLFFWWSVLSQM